MILHGVPSWNHRREDSIRNPRLLDEGNRLLKFDRVVMNPPFSLEDWGYDDLLGGDPHHRFEFGMPPRDNGDYAWLQQVAKSLKDDGKAIIVMSQGVLFRGQPEQTEEEDGRKQKADSEYVIREGFVKRDFIECVIVLPSKLFYGNSVPGCLVVINKSKEPQRKGKILMIWASRHFQKANPQNILRPSDLMRVLVPWGAFGDLEQAKALVPKHEARLVAEEEAERDRRMKDIEEAYAPLLEPAVDLKAELGQLEASDYARWKAKPRAEHPFFGGLARIEDKSKLRRATSDAKKAYANRLKQLKADIKELAKLQTERDEREKEVKDQFDREIAHIHVAAADLLRICSDEQEAVHHFAIADMPEVRENEFNLNLSRYVDTFETEEEILLTAAINELKEASTASNTAQNSLMLLLQSNGEQ